MSKIIETKRLILRTWHDEDLQPMFAINQNPKVIDYSTCFKASVDRLGTYVLRD